MTFLAPWALALGAFAALATVVLHLVATQRPAAYVFPTTRFIPDQRTLVSRAATRPRDLLLLALRILLLLSAAAAFARPVVTPRRGAIARVVVLDRSRAVADPSAAVERARSLVGDDAPYLVIVFDSIATTLAAPQWDSLRAAPHSGAPGSLSAALIAARRASLLLADRADSVQLIIVSAFGSSAVDSATRRIRDAWPGSIRTERVSLRSDPGESWHLERPLIAQDPLGPSMIGVRATTGARTTRLTRGPFSDSDSAFARAGGTVVRWDSIAAARALPEGLAVGDDVVVAAFERRTLAGAGRPIARWADGVAAAIEVSVGSGCIRDVGIAIPGAGDLALHPPFQRIVRGLLAPCALKVAEQPVDSAFMRSLAGAQPGAARSRDLRNDANRPSPIATWLLAMALLLAFAELVVRGRPVAAGAA
ncbi:MAG: BatA domain-containing protein [Gemmatimonadota bacterium]